LNARNLHTSDEDVMAFMSKGEAFVWFDVEMAKVLAACLSPNRIASRGLIANIRA
jgi:hypothetical protein